MQRQYGSVCSTWHRNETKSSSKSLLVLRLERLLYRLASSEYAERFVSKGALLFRLWFDLEQRPTRDADFLGFGSAEPKDLALIFREASAIKTDYDDGIHFNIDSVEAQEVRKAAAYPGVRVTMEALLSGARIAVQCDIGFGDAVTPAPMVKSYPALLDMPAPKLRVYPLETVVAEKLDHDQLPNAVRATFE